MSSAGGQRSPLRIYHGDYFLIEMKELRRLGFRLYSILQNFFGPNANMSPKMPGAGIAESFQVEYKAIIKRKVNLIGMGAL